ncbi:MAG: hypothetical protein KJO55_03220 [Gammaproteobacteria bacterium]|nr:hypothetical protein [Gammaproteobacteria bacterium]NND61055.1 hypothetical protein [Gammaproteobacteria bacterium]
MQHDSRVVAVANLREFFRDSLEEAMCNQQVAAAADTSHYIVNLLTLFARADELYRDDAGPGIKPLAFMLTDALEASTAYERDRALRRLGDVSLFMAGFFAHSFARRLVDIDYYISMGGNAYAHLSDLRRGGAETSAWEVFEELAAKFQRFVDVLNEVSEMSRDNKDADVLRLFEIWMRTGSPRAAAHLRKLGIEPSLYSVSLQTQ